MGGKTTALNLLQLVVEYNMHASGNDLLGNININLVASDKFYSAELANMLMHTLIFK